MRMYTRKEMEGALRAAGLSYECLETADGGWAVIVPELGAKVLAAGVDEESLLWVNRIPEKGAWCVGGQRTWLAPELGPRGFFGTTAEDWSVPPALDPGGYRRIGGEAGELAYRCDLTLNRLDGVRFVLGITRAIRVEAVSGGSGRRGLKIVVDNRLANRMERTLEEEVGLWSIIQVPAEVASTFLIPLKPPAPEDPSTRPAGDPLIHEDLASDAYRLYFGDLPPDWVAASPTLLAVKAHAGRWWKIGVPPGRSTGAGGYLRPSRFDDQHFLVLLRTAVEPAGRYLDKPPGGSAGNGDVLQCYNSPDRKTANFCELEAHAPTVRLGPGEEQHACVEILFFKDGLEELWDVARRFLDVADDPLRLFSTPSSPSS